MEILPSGVQCVRDSDCPQQSFRADFSCDGESQGIHHGGQAHAAHDSMDELIVTAEVLAVDNHGEDPRASDKLDSGKAPNCNSYSSGEDSANRRNDHTEPCLMPENSHLFVDIIESESPDRKEGEFSLSESEPTWLDDSESVAVWVKWRGMWQAGIKCARADWPLSSLKAKPTHDRKKYFLIFFPQKRNYSWTDMLLVRSINEFSEPLASETHSFGLKIVEDLTAAQQFIMRKLALGMLNILEQFHTEALIESARDMMAWKEFALEASYCIGYSNLARMLLKLQSMILPCFIKSDWIRQSFPSWAQRCETANSAESVEILKEELNECILWNNVKSLGDALVQSTLGPEWKTWKYEVMEWSPTSHSSNGGDVEQASIVGPLTTSLHVSRKRPKLEVRRADTNSIHPHAKGTDASIAAVEIDSGYFNSRDTENGATLASEPCGDGEEDVSKGVALVDSTNDMATKWREHGGEAGNYNIIQTTNLELTPANQVVAAKSLVLGSKNRQCIAFIESKGRQCVRWANDGDVYCCVHLASRFANNSSRAETPPSVQTQMCEGTTVLGTRCKHRSLYGSSFCKKHRPHNDINKKATSSNNSLKRKLEESIPNSETTNCKAIELVEDADRSFQLGPISVTRPDEINGRNRLVEKPEHVTEASCVSETMQCLALPHDNSYSCSEIPKKYSLYCEKHLPSWLKRARNGKSRVISKEVFIDLLKDCCSQEKKVHLHQACELFYKLFKSILSLRNPVPMEVQFQWALSEASKSFGVGEFFLKLVKSEKDRLRSIWGFSAEENAQVAHNVEEQALLPLGMDSSQDNEMTIKCKICSEEFVDEETIGTHWMESHKKEAQWLFRGYACALCLESFTNKKVLETHVQERHHSKFVEHCMLLRCIPCGSHFGNSDELWLHVQSVHRTEFQPSEGAQQQNLPRAEDSFKNLQMGNPASAQDNPENAVSFRKFVCRFCGLKFDLLPDLGRHHQAAHMGPNLVSPRPAKRGIRYYAYRLKSGRLSRPRFKKGLGALSHRLRNKSGSSLKRCIQSSKSLSLEGVSAEPRVTEAAALGQLAESHCSAVAKILFREVQKTKPRPDNTDLLSFARSACCKISFIASLEKKYGLLPERFYLKALRLCSEQNIHVIWHQDSFICPQGCKPANDMHVLSPLMSLPCGSVKQVSTNLSAHINDEWEVDESHCVVDSHHFRKRPFQKAIVLCKDISFGKEPIQVACVLDENPVESHHMPAHGYDLQNVNCSRPWKGFIYVTKPVVDRSLSPDAERLQLGCACPNSVCHPEACDHVYLFNSDYEDARDIYGNSMRGRFPYDNYGRIVLEEGYLVYECNHMCSCSRSCPNRVLQNGVQARLEVFKTQEKGWALRAGEAILRGTFICEYIGEVLDQQEANRRRKMYGRGDCDYFYKIGAHNNDMNRLMGSQAQYFIDATRYGNVSRFINHSCSPNLVTRQVLVESMDSCYAHIGLYANRDIVLGEELTCDYGYEFLPGDGYPCRCEATNCRGRLY